MTLTAFSHELINKSAHSPKQVEVSGGQATNYDNVPHLLAIITSNTACTFKMVYCTMHAAALQRL